MANRREKVSKNDVSLNICNTKIIDCFSKCKFVKSNYQKFNLRKI